MPKAGQRPPPLAIALAVILLALMVWPIWTAARNGLSGLYARPAIGYLEDKRFDDYKLSPAEWLAIEKSVAVANKLMPRNPQYLEALGLVHQLGLGLFGDDLSAEEIDAYTVAAEYYFQRAIASRPTWTYYWGNVALEHYRRGSYATDEYSQALTNAGRFGPWKNDTQRLVIDLGTETWEFLSNDAKQEVVLSVERGLHRQPENTIRIVRSHNASPRLCEASRRIVSVPLPHLQALCAQETFAK